MGTLVWESPWPGFGFLVLGLALVALGAWSQHRRGLKRNRIVILTALRVVPVLIIAFLLARPVRVISHDDKVERKVMLLVDQSASMALKDAKGGTRFEDALDFARELAPRLERAGYHLQPVLFDAGAKLTDGRGLVAAKPEGGATDLGAGVSAALNLAERPPLAVVALTDGASNQPQSNRAAVGALLASQAPFIGVGFGTERGVQTLNLLDVDAPKLTPPNSQFRISARIEATASKLPAFDLMLLRDGKFHSKKHVAAGEGMRYWTESFEVTEPEEGAHTYDIQIEMTADPDLVLVNAGHGATVRIAKEQEMRVLYMQGALTWDYKFVGRALRGDPTVHITGLSRTSERSVFRQNVESPGELVSGFPTDVKELAPFRVVVLANLNPKLLNPAQQEAIAKFCGDYGGGVLMIGGAGTFDSSWRASRLEQLLPVRFDENRGVRGLDQPFQIKLTREALADPVFEISDPGKTREAWQKLPAFDDYGRVAEAKPGATIWAVHSKDVGPDGKPRILMASQPYGGGMVAVIAVQNFWKWRLAKDCDQSAFDRFWQQFIRRLAESGRQPVRIEVMDQELRPGREIGLTIEKLADAAKAGSDGAMTVQFQVRTSKDELVTERAIELKSGRGEQASFVPEKADHYSLEVKDAKGVSLASRVLEIRAPNIELQKTARDMESLKQWAMLSNGSAWEIDEARREPEAFAKAIGAQIEAARLSTQERLPAGMNVWTFLLVVAPLCAGWLLRRKWMLG